MALLSFGSAPAATVRVPLDEATIQAGIHAAASGDTVLIACGTYTEFDSIVGKEIALLGETGEPGCVTIDAEGESSVLFVEAVGSGCLIRGITFVGGIAGQGGGALLSGASPRLENCVFRDNNATNGAGIACVTTSSPTLVDCLIVGNTSSSKGGGLYSNASCTVTLQGCTLAENWAYFGGGIYAGFNCAVVMERTIIAFGDNGAAIYCDGTASATLSCCDLFGNSNGDWVGACVEAQAGSANNFSADPQFCGAYDSMNFFLQSDSPCAPGLSSCGLLVGALDVGCAETAIARDTWSGLKALYR